MPVLTVYVNDRAVTLDLHERDDMVAVCCELEQYGVDPAFPEITMNGQEINQYQKVNFHATYRFGK